MGSGKPKTHPHRGNKELWRMRWKQRGQDTEAGGAAHTNIRPSAHHAAQREGLQFVFGLYSSGQVV